MIFSLKLPGSYYFWAFTFFMAKNLSFILFYDSLLETGGQGDFKIDRLSI